MGSEEVISESCSMSFCLVWSRIQPCAQAPGQEREAGHGGSVGGLQHFPDSELEVMPWCRHGGDQLLCHVPTHQAVLILSFQLPLGPLIPP